MDLAAFKVRFDGQMAEFLDAALHAFSATLSDPSLAPFVAHTKDLALAGGKRIRPYLAYVMASDSGYPEEEILRCALAWELFHLFALVHDDVMDGGEERHGIPTAHAFLEKQLKKTSPKSEHARVAQGQAILLGDLLLSLAHQSLVGVEERGLIARDRLHVANSIFLRMSREVIAGQMLDLHLTTIPEASFALIARRNHLKTSTYTFIRPMQFGVALADSGKEALQFCEEFGTLVGQAFQLQDDLLDVRGGATGKTSMRDIREGQQTVLTQFVLEHGKPNHKKTLTALLGTDVSAQEEKTLLEVFQESGAFAHVEGLIANALSGAKVLLQDAVISSAACEQLEQVIAVLERRTA